MPGTILPGLQGLRRTGLSYTIETREQIEDFFVVEFDERDPDERLDGVADSQVVEDVAQSARDDSQFAVLGPML